MPSMTTTEDVVVKKRLKIKYGTKKFETECVVSEVKPAQTVPLIDDWGHSAALKEKSESVESESYRVPSSVGVKNEELVKPNLMICKKRGPSELVEGHKEKRQKMDRGISQQCSNLLKKLMSHKSGWPFLAPVDPVALCIPDYFSVIKHPMDLGTIKARLGKNKYDHVDEFAADVRLTFSNAMTYNPPGNYVHGMAKELNDLFNRLWKSVEKKLGQDQSNEKSMKLTIGFKRSDSAPKLFVKPATQPGTVISNSNMPSLGTDKLTRPMEVELPNSREECPIKIARSTSLKGTNGGDKTSYDLTLSKSPLSSAATVCTLCTNIRCCCSAGNDLPSGKSVRKDKSNDNPIAHKDVMSSTKPACQRSNSDPESDGAGRTLGEDNAYHSSNLTTDASSEEEWQTPAMEVQLSPKRALRAAWLKTRFAGTILKAQQKTLLDHADKVDALKIQQQKEIMERQQREERIRLEAEIKAAEAVERQKAEAERRAQREREREAARIALQKMERTVEFHETVGALKEIEMLCGCPVGSPIDVASPEVSPLPYEKGGNPLEQLGLFMKDDFLGGEEEEEPEDCEISKKVDGEEGEIIP
uniref:Bromo domain-containing protein n=1 Tax=Kalanchoe fedtschenkoi TaxID=63787 RepID=A0A7N0U2X4_KALFE